VTSHPPGWFVGHFVEPADDPRATQAVEVKWHTHPVGESKTVWTKSIEATSLAVLISGRMIFRFPEREILLSRQGDYVLWSPGIFHTWNAVEESVILTIRWPSRKDDVVIADERQTRHLEDGSFKD
jgi:hypothetical protein